MSFKKNASLPFDFLSRDEKMEKFGTGWNGISLCPCFDFLVKLGRSRAGVITRILGRDWPAIYISLVFFLFFLFWYLGIRKSFLDLSLLFFLFFSSLMIISTNFRSKFKNGICVTEILLQIQIIFIAECLLDANYFWVIKGCYWLFEVSIYINLYLRI